MNKPVSVQISTYWWDETLQKDIPATSVAVTIWVARGSVGKAFQHTCYSPQELWDYMHLLNTDLDKVLKEEFGFTPKGRTIPANLEDLFK